MNECENSFEEGKDLKTFFPGFFYPKFGTGSGGGGGWRMETQDEYNLEICSRSNNTTILALGTSR